MIACVFLFMQILFVEIRWGYTGLSNYKLIDNLFSIGFPLIAGFYEENWGDFLEDFRRFLDWNQFFQIVSFCDIAGPTLVAWSRSRPQHANKSETRFECYSPYWPICSVIGNHFSLSPFSRRNASFKCITLRLFVIFRRSQEMVAGCKARRFPMRLCLLLFPDKSWPKSYGLTLYLTNVHMAQLSMA